MADTPDDGWDRPLERIADLLLEAHAIVKKTDNAVLQATIEAGLLQVGRKLSGVHDDVDGETLIQDDGAASRH